MTSITRAHWAASVLASFMERSASPRAQRLLERASQLAEIAPYLDWQAG